MVDRLSRVLPVFKSSRQWHMGADGDAHLKAAITIQALVRGGKARHAYPLTHRGGSSARGAGASSAFASTDTFPRGIPDGANGADDGGEIAVSTAHGRRRSVGDGLTTVSNAVGAGLDRVRRVSIATERIMRIPRGTPGQGSPTRKASRQIYPEPQLDWSGELSEPERGGPAGGEDPGGDTGAGIAVVDTKHLEASSRHSCRFSSRYSMLRRRPQRR